MISQLALLSRWEWYKLSRRRMPWVLLIIALAVPQVVLWGSFSVFQFSDATRGVFVLPSSLLTALRTSYTTGVILILVLSSTVVGSEYGWGTLRTALAKGPGRWQFLVSKALLLALLGLATLLLVSLTVAISSLIAAYLTIDDTGWFDQRSQWSEFGVILGKTAFGLVPYMVIGLFFTVLTSSSAGGVSISLAYYFVVEQIVAPLLSFLFDWFDPIFNYVLGHAVDGWMAESGGAVGLAALANSDGLPSVLHGFLVMLGYIVVAGAASLWLFQRRDVTGARGD